jgi:hypothetical protein
MHTIPNLFFLRLSDGGFDPKRNHFYTELLCQTSGYPQNYVKNVRGTSSRNVVYKRINKCTGRC